MNRPTNTTATGLAARDLAAGCIADIHSGRVRFAFVARTLRRLDRTDLNPARADLTRAVRYELIRQLRGPRESIDCVPYTDGKGPYGWTVAGD